MLPLLDVAEAAVSLEDAEAGLLGECGIGRRAYISSRDGAALVDAPEPEQCEQEQEPEPYELSESEEVAILFANAPQHQREEAMRKMYVLQKTKGLGGRALKQALQVLKQQDPKYSYSVSQVYAMRKLSPEQLLGRRGLRKGETCVPEEWGAVYRDLALKPGGPSFGSCYTAAFGIIQEQLKPDLTWEEFPSRASFKRWFDLRCPAQVAHIARKGANSARNKFGAYIIRDYTSVVAGQVWVCDHAQLDIMVTIVRGGRTETGFPWVTAWQDFKSQKWLGWNLHMEPPCTRYVKQSFYNAAKEHGIGQAAYLDNGKDFRCRQLTGGFTKGRLELDEKEILGLFPFLGVDVKFAWPYNGRSKPIERSFLNFKLYVSKHAVGYRGGTVLEKPEVLKDERAAGNLLEFEQLVAILDLYVTTVANRRPRESGYLKGKFPDQVWDEEAATAAALGIRRKLSFESLAGLLLAQTEPKLCGRNGYYDSSIKQWFYSEEMEGYKGTKTIYLRYDPRDIRQAMVFDAKTGEALCTANLVHRVAAWANNPVDLAQLKLQVKAERNVRKALVSAAKADTVYDLEARTRGMATAIDQQVRESGYVPNATQVQLSTMATGFDRIPVQQKRISNGDFTNVLSLTPKIQERKPLLLLECEREQNQESESVSG